MELRARTHHFARLAAFSAAAAALLALVAGPATADAAKAKKRYPVVSSVTPMDAKVGDTISIKGRYFVRGRNKNTVVFKADGQRAVFAKKTLGTAKLIRVVVPEGLRSTLVESKPTRVRVRVLAERFGKSFTAVSKSPRITAAPLPIDGSGTGSGTSTGTGTGTGTTGDPTPPAKVCPGDEDGDMLTSAEENKWGLDSCKADTDGDGVPDGYEYWSARDLNDDEYQDANQYLPYPGPRPYPNPLFKDADVDYDGDGLYLSAEYRLWDRFGAKPAGGLLADGYRLYYSDGEQYSLSDRQGGTGRRVPTEDAATYGKSAEFLSWAASAGYNPVYIAKNGPHWYSARQPYDIRDVNLLNGVEASEQWLADTDSDGWISDDERDEDADGLSNLDELRSRMTSEYWKECYADTKELPYVITYADTDLVEKDTDGDGVRDGADDQDHDDIPNVMELSRYDASGGFVDWHARKGTCHVLDGLMDGPDIDGDGKSDPVVRHDDIDYGRVHPFNPCLPFKWSRTCPGAVEFGDKYAPFDNSPWYSLQ